MTNQQTSYAQKIKEQYQQQPKTKLDELKSLDKKVKRPVRIFSYVFGTISSLVLGTGMCLAMKVIGDAMILGIGIGLVGILLTSITYPIHKKMMKSRKDKYAEQIIGLTESLINE